MPAATAADNDRDGSRDAEIAIVMPVLNAEDTITTQLEALAQQTYENSWCLVLADNGSDDRSLAIAQGYADRLPLRIVDASAKRGAAFARNVGARACQSRLLGFVDADDAVAPEWLANVVHALTRHPAVASRFGKERLNPPNLRETRDLAQEHGLGAHNYAPFLPHAGGSGLAVHRRVHEEIGGFDESLLRLQDTDYCWRIQLAGYALHYEPSALLHVRFRPEGRTALSQAFTQGRYNGRLYYRYRSQGMEAVPLVNTLKQIVVLVAKLPTTRDPLKRVKRQRTAANLIGIAIGRLEAPWRIRRA